ncbi:MAG: CxxxxCH/CxxCH domain-containing protein [Desulfuromonadales bacterium]|nr:CxxxxCH/CxxCH domain-containing protein [Desulfuromonadales bacterium]
MGKNSASRRRYSQVVAGFAALVSLSFGTCLAEAASFLNSCTTYCHGTPPRDGARKGNPHFGSQSSAFIGNHKNHLSAAPSTNDCSICHVPVVATGFGHQNNVVDMAVKLKAYSTTTGRARYDKGVFFNMTSIPNLTNATCSNVSCHFEKKTPVWGSAAYNIATDCNACHGAPPAGTAATPAGGLTGSHARHDVYFPGAGNCQKCHPSYTTFIHATSAGRALKVQGFLRNPLNTLETSGTYSGSGANYLPSKSASQVFGSCNTIYCHSTGQSVTGTGTGLTFKAVTWGSAALTCASCHVDMATDATGTGSHRVHTIATGANFDCAVCHAGYTKTTISTATHTNGLIELGAAGFTYSQGSGATHPVANGYGTCSASSCHGQGTVTWGATAAAPVNGFPFSASQCDKCHSGTAAAPFYSTAIPKVIINTNAKVGAHTSHLTAPDGLATAFACTDCHGAVTLNSATHMNGTTNFTWSTLATKSGALAPTYTAATGACANVYCHGASMPGGDASGTNRAPAWNSSTYLPATLTAAACGTCHGFPPSAVSGHPAVTVPAGFPATVTIGTTCSCHSNINTAGNSYATMFVSKALHINGTVEVSGGHAVPFYAHTTPPFTSCTGCHNASAAGAYPAAVAGTSPNCRGCHITSDPTVTSTGCSSCHTSPPSGTTHPNAVGSHVKHGLLAGVTMPCTVCHNGAGSGSGASHGPGNKGTNPAVDNVIFTAAQAGASATWTAATKTCSTTYCHGATLTGGTNKSPVWGTTLTGCGLCHGDPPATTTHSGVTVTQCITCHDHVNAAGTGFTNAALHMNGVIDASGGSCISCHASVQTGTHGTPRDAIMTEFGLAWGHKKTGRGAVTDADCIVCHLEGDFATQKPSPKHKDGNIDLRDPDGVGEVPIKNISGGVFTFTKFATSYAAGSRTSTGHLSNTDNANVISQKFCLTCHDNNGATNTTARSNNGGTGTAAMPFGGRALGTTYTAANNAIGTQGLIDVKTQFALTNSSRHPVLGPRTRDFPYSTRLAVPYNNIGTARDTNAAAGHTTAASVVLNCFDCHNTPTTPLTSRTVAAHGNAVTLRGTVYAGSAASTLCTTCHTGYTGTGQHGTGSAWSVTGSSHNVSRGCEYCHGSQTSTTAQVRPIRAQDYHGSNARVGGGLWPTVNSRPYAFIRGWSGTAYHRPYRATEFTTGSATCGAGTCPGGGQVADGSTRTYTAGGTY